MKTHNTYGRVVLLMAALVVSACSHGEGDEEGGLAVRVSGEAEPADAGLPTYPGSKPYADGDDSHSAANLRLSTAAFGFKVVAMNLETADAPERVAAFYRGALSKYGPILDCSNGAQERAAENEGGDGDELTCDADDGDGYSFVYKVGAEENQRIVAIKPHGDGARFSLAHVDVRDRSER